jgi:ribosomal protein L30E
MNSKLTGLLTICRKAGRMVMGFDPSKEAIETGKAFSVITACDISPKTEKEIKFFAGKKSIPVVKSDCTIDDFYHSLGKKVGVIAVCDEGFSSRALLLISENETEM